MPLPTFGLRMSGVSSALFAAEGALLLENPVCSIMYPVSVADYEGSLLRKLSKMFFYKISILLSTRVQADCKLHRSHLMSALALTPAILFASTTEILLYDAFSAFSPAV
jgi:hypothetical protein